MKNLGIKAKIWLCIAIFGAGYVVLLILLQWTTSESQTHMKVASGSLFPAALASQEAQAGFQRVTKRYSDAVLLQDKKALASASEDAQSVTAALQSVKEKTAFNSDLQKQVSSLMEYFSDIQTRSKATYSLMIEAPDKMTDKTQADIASLAKDNKQMEASLGELGSGLAKNFQSELDIVTTWNQRQRTFGILVLLIALGCGGGVAGYVISRQIAQPLNQLASRLRDIAEGEGDLTVRLDFASKDEIGETGASFDLFMDKLQEIMRKVAANTGQLASATEEISASATLMAQRSETQQNQTSQVATSMHEMSSTVLQVSENSNKAAETSRQAGLIVEQTLNNMRIIASSVKGTAQKMEELGKSSDQIGHIAGVI